ncbi:MAG: malto-oligosyltrehalose synthase [Acidimicrobiales bacterium]
MSGRPRATYRLQLRADFGFDDAAAIADHLAVLGVSHVYTSPYLQAAPGSAHGYDVIDHSRVNDELGGPEAHARFVAAIRSAGLGQVVDVVPNHMAIGPPENLWWWDVLENGRSSRYAAHFDVDWDPPESKLRDQVLLPILGDHYGRVIERGEIALAWDDDGRFRLRYFDHVVPVSPRSVDTLLIRASERCGRSGADHLAFIGHSFARLPSATTTDLVEQHTRHRDKEVLYQQLVRLATDHPDVVDAVAAEVAALNADVDALDRFLERQNVRLAFWRTAGHDLDYRRFFDINSLVALRVEAAEVFADTHQLVLRWLADGDVDGVRIDHPDGLRDPTTYFELLRASAPDAWIVVEKILEPGERLPESWPVDGTTGYDFCHVVTRLLHDPRGETPLREFHSELTGDDTPLAEIIHSAKVAILGDSLAADVNRVVGAFVALAEQHRRSRDLTRPDMHAAVVETAASFPVYRTYVGPDGRADATDRAVIAEAIEAAAERRPDLDDEVFAFLRAVLGGEVDPGPGLATELRLRFQQLSSPVMAKGVEDTAFYDHVPLASLNEVGADPTVFAIEPEEFHRSMGEAATSRPASMLTLSTHDTKRSEDVRARLAVLSEVPGAWAEAVRRWRSMADELRTEVGATVRPAAWPDARMEHLLFQTLVGAHPLSADRATEYMTKAVREAKRHTSWTDPDPDYDAAVEAFVRGVCADDSLTSDIAAFVDTIVDAGRSNALAQKLLSLTAPGVPDIYQGTELWDLSLVDPDNRRPVDHDLRRRLISELDTLDVGAVAARADEGLPKLWLVTKALDLRTRHPEVFESGGYASLEVTGPAAGHVVASVRGGRVATVVTRLPFGLHSGGGWRDTTIDLPPGRWRDELSGQVWEGGGVPVVGVLEHLPVALLHRDDDSGSAPLTDPGGS